MLELNIHTQEEDIDDVGAGITDDMLDELDETEDEENESATKKSSQDDDEQEDDLLEGEEDSEDVDYDTFDDVDEL